MVISWHWSQYWVLTFLSQLMGPNFSSSSLSVMVGLPMARPNTDNINNDSAFIVHSSAGPAEGKVAGSFTIALPDGRIQTTTYTADHYNGFVAEVTYEGTPVYPPEPAGGYGHPAPAYKPAPAYHA